MKPTATSRSAFTNVTSRHRHHQRINVHAATAAKPNVSACICKQANVSLPWRHSTAAERPCELACVRQTTHKPTNIRQRITASSRSAAKHQQTSPKMLGQFPPATKRGRQRRALGQNRAAAPQRRPRAREPFSSGCELCDGTQAPGSVVESCVKCPE